ncbi:hypothetical protein DEO72_LG8g1132 [Vigna unguiculata]|uniref:Uncharacterized protein n=1 Tax=Vigna unguiculata TaxID=3917 RepID=A0A4D6MR44_VIGUN|nr:hypothetical protein DEO72_LG8g1132 [Vigna unguiculata]
MHLQYHTASQVLFHVASVVDDSGGIVISTPNYSEPPPRPSPSRNRCRLQSVKPSSEPCLSFSAATVNGGAPNYIARKTICEGGARLLLFRDLTR